jgi:RHH-type proline utilization regulon transcriptional repressor/proline dehydrogenase/delta 1-pyrroline-5-carboxylate dehydrogenase
MSDRIYPQFATHNAHTIAAVLHIAKEKGVSNYEFQRLHGMGEALHDQVLKKSGTPCRIYAPVGRHSDLLAYLVRRLLENGANSSFVNQIFDPDVSSLTLTSDPFDKFGTPGPDIANPKDIFAPNRVNSAGFDLADPEVLFALQQARFEPRIWKFGTQGEAHKVFSPATGSEIGQVRFLSAQDAEAKINSAEPWQASAIKRAAVLRRVADLYESHADDIFTLLTHEAGKTLLDCIGELREAVDFLRFYAAEVELNPLSPAGIFVCISPWNFPLAIFTGQIAAALASGNGVLAKPAESTSMISYFAVELMHLAGVPASTLQLIAGQGTIVGPILCSAPSVTGVCFTGSIATAHVINRTMAHQLPSHIPLIAETGGLNAMIVDSTALLEQAVRDVLVSAFQSAGQRCSALRILYVQSDIAENFKKMLFGAMQALVVCDPARIDCDVGPVIDEIAREKILQHIAQSNILFSVKAPKGGTFVPPTVLAVSGIGDLGEEIFGPVLHLTTFAVDELEQVIHDINASGYGLTFGLHSRIDDRVQKIITSLDVGNLYINRNQIGAVVGSQPFGGHGLSGTGPKAGGPRYLPRFTKQNLLHAEGELPPRKTAEEISSAFACKFEFSSFLPIDLPGPTGESNRYTLTPRRRVLCIGVSAKEHAKRAKALGCHAIAATMNTHDLTLIKNLEAVVYAGSNSVEIRQALSNRTGPIVPILMDENFEMWLVREHSICINTTAAGGNVTLLGG